MVYFDFVFAITVVGPCLAVWALDRRRAGRVSVTIEEDR